MSCPRCMRRSTTARGTPMYGTRRMRWRANSRQMTRPSRRRSDRSIPPPLTTESPTTHYCTVQHHVPIDPYAERMPRADCSSNTIRDSISRVSPSLRDPRFAPALRHARRPCALTRGRPAVPRQPGTGIGVRLYSSRRWGALAPQRKTRRFTGDREFGVATASRCCMGFAIGSIVGAVACPLTNAQRRSQRR